MEAGNCQLAIKQKPYYNEEERKSVTPFSRFSCSLNGWTNNLEVQKEHTYYVSEEEVLVHNMCKDGGRGFGKYGGKKIEITGNQPAVIRGRTYSGHAVDQMISRGVPPSAVENAIVNGVTIPGNNPGTFVHSFENIKAVTNTAGDVVTIMR